MPKKSPSFLEGPEQHRKDSHWEFAEGRIPHNVGICRYAKDERTLGAKHFARDFEVKIAGKNYPVALFGIFDPHIGPEASNYLHLNFEKVLGLLLPKIKDPSEAEIYNAIAGTILQLNRDFATNFKSEADPSGNGVIADHGSTATVGIIMLNTLWMAQLGDSRGVLENGGNPIQVTLDAMPFLPRFKEKVESLGGFVTEKGLVQGRSDERQLGMATAFGHYYLRGAVNSKPGIIKFDLNRLERGSHLVIGTCGIFEMVSTSGVAAWLSSRREKTALDLAHDVVYSIHTGQKEKTPLSCMVVKLNSGSGKREA